MLNSPHEGYFPLHCFESTALIFLGCFLFFYFFYVWNNLDCSYWTVGCDTWWFLHSCEHVCVDSQTLLLVSIFIACKLVKLVYFYFPLSDVLNISILELVCEYMSTHTSTVRDIFFSLWSCRLCDVPNMLIFFYVLMICGSVFISLFSLFHLAPITARFLIS